MPLCSSTFLRLPNSALRSPKSFVNAIMFAQAANRHASTKTQDKTQSTLHSNSKAVNVPPSNKLKRKFDRSMSTSNLGSLHTSAWSDENTPPTTAYMDLTNSPEKSSDVVYPTLGRVGHGDQVTYPTLPPNPSASPKAPTSSAPVAWSSSPVEHFQNPRPREAPHEQQPTAAARPAKKRALPASFTAKPPIAPRNDLYVKHDINTKYHKDSVMKQHQTGVTKSKASQAMSDMLEKSSIVRQRTTASLLRDTSDRTAPSLTKPEEKETSATKGVQEVFLSDEQKTVMKAVLEEGKSVFFTGSAGTGKSVLMRSIISQLRHKYRAEPDRFSVTASTGLASCILEGQTLHSWSGIGLGKEPAPELVKKIRKNQKSRQRWLRTKLLIIDEVSMVDGQLFDKLEQVARTIRNNGRPFGGIQLVVTGDFFQLPPVPDKNTTAKFVFDAVTWNTCIQHTILLTHVFRQKDEQFANMLNEMRLGKMSPATVREFKSLSRPLNFHDDLEATEL